MSNVADASLAPEVEDPLLSVESSLDALIAGGFEPTGGAEAMELARRVDRVARKVRLAQIEVVAGIEAAGSHVPDGHRSAQVMVGFVNHLSEPEAKRRDRARRMLAAMPAVRAGLASGRIGPCQVDRIGLTWVNPRVREELQAVDAQVAVLAAMLPYEEFARRMANWVAQVDEDGTADRARRCQENRRARMVQEFDGGWELLGGFGSLTGAQMHRILQGFTEAEFQADWAAAREVHGDATTVAHLARTHDQRAADAVARIFELAADAHAASPGGAPIDTTIVIDHETFERELRRAAGGAIEPRPAPDLHPLPTDPDLPPGLLDDLQPAGDPAPQGDRVPATADERGRHPGREFRCETSDGHPVHPTEAFVNALTGQVRRAVVGWNGVVLDMSGRHKLFTGPLRHAILLAALRCFWPGCRVKHPHCQADHLDPRRNGGRTNPDNGGPACGMHNRLKEHGFTARRDERGRMHVLRPDGTEIQPWC